MIESISQSQNISKVLERFNLNDCQSVSTPLADHFKLSKQDSPKNKADRIKMQNDPYTSAVGSLMYAMDCTRPDIALAVGVVSRYMSPLGWEHWQAIKWILRYLKGTQDVCLCFVGLPLKVVGFVDADHAGCQETQRSTTGYVFKVSGGTISWMSTPRDIVTLSTTEVEYVTFKEALKEMIWLKRLLGELGVK